MKKWLPVLVLALLFGAGTMGVQAQQQVPILLYHNLASSYENPLLHITREQFAQHMAALRQAGYQSITYAELIEAGASGGGTLPVHPIIITFDDGYRSVYTDAFPILQEQGLCATVFVITGRMGAKAGDFPHFSWEEAREMEQSGVVDIESHSHTHPDFSVLSQEDTRLEAGLSKFLIESHLHKCCKVFAYPFGTESPYAQELQAAGYQAVNLVGDDGSNQISEGTMHLKRLTVCGDQPAQQVLDMIQQAG